MRISEEFNPDIVLLDIGMPGDGLDALDRIMQLGLSTRCVMLTACEQAGAAIRALNKGARGYVLKGIGAGELLAAVSTVLEDNTYVSQVFATVLFSAAQGGQAKEGARARLTHRESQILVELEKGRTNREIGEKLMLSEKTVKFYMSNIMQNSASIPASQLSWLSAAAARPSVLPGPAAKLAPGLIAMDSDTT